MRLISIVPSGLSSLTKYAMAHKAASVVIVIFVVLVGNWTYGKLFPVDTETRYILSTVATGTIVATVSGSGQVAASNQVDVKPKASGEVIAVQVKEGQTVGAGAVLAYIDSTDAQKAVRDAQTNLETAQLNLEKLQQPADTLSLTQSQNALARAIQSQQNDEDNLKKAYADGFTDIANTFIDFPADVAGLHEILYGTDRTLGGANQWNLDFYANIINQYSNTLQGTAFRDDADAKYAAAKASYDKAFADYKVTSPSADSATIQSMMQEAQTALANTIDAIKSANNLIQLYKETSSTYSHSTASAADTHISSLNSYLSSLNAHSSTLLSQLNTIKTTLQSIEDDVRTIDEQRQSLAKLEAGTDALDLRSSQIAVQQKQDGLTDAKNALADYAIRAPFAGAVAKLSIQKGDTVSSGTTAVTMITAQEIAELSLNEIDATQVAVGKKATLTFDAIEGLSVTGEVASIDSIGTVSQGVVSYVVKIGFDTQDARIKPGMTVNADIQTNVAQNALVVPSGAVKTSGGSSYVQVFNPAIAETGGSTGIVSKNAPQSVPVAIGISDGINIQILSGLSGGEQIVSRTISGSTPTAAASATTNTRGGIGGIRL